MQLTLVSHYLDKPPEFARLINELQTSLSPILGSSFCPYGLAQVHGTIIGLEGTQVAGGVRNEHFLRYRNEEQFIDFTGLLDFLRREFGAFAIRVGGFSATEDYGFTSQGRHPFHRSFSLGREIAVAMGWPVQDGKVLSALDQLRRRLQQFGLLHKWHRRPNDVDNDFFFVLGRVNGVLSEERRLAAERQLRDQVARRDPLLLPLSCEALSFVAYHDSQLPPASSRAGRLTDAGLTPDVLLGMYSG